MKILLIEDNSAIADAIKQVFDEDKDKITVVSNPTLDVNEYLKGKYGLTILDTAVGGNRGLSFLDRLLPNDTDSTKERRKGNYSSPILVIKRNNALVPADCIFVKAEISFPFTTSQFKEKVEAALSKQPKQQGFLERHFASTDQEYVKSLEGTGVLPGGAYLFAQSTPKGIRQATKALSSAGMNPIVVTAQRSKVAREVLGLRGSSVVHCLTGPKYKLGTMLDEVNDFVNEVPNPLLVIDNLGDLIDHCGLDRTMRVLVQLVKQENRNYTVLAYIEGASLTRSLREVFQSMMKIYGDEENGSD